MDKVQLLLNVLTIMFFVIPILGIVVAYRGSLQDLFIPPELNGLVTTLLNAGRSGNSLLTQPALVGPIEYDPATRSVTFTFEFNNSFPIGIRLNSLFGDVLCATDGTALGIASMRDPVWIGSGETKTLTVVAAWTDAALAHFQSLHSGERVIDVYLLNVTVNAGGVKITNNEPVRINDVPIA
jgi:hypothetical protein